MDWIDANVRAPDIRLEPIRAKMRPALQPEFIFSFVDDA
jgi:hypothetical protein